PGRRGGRDGRPGSVRGRQPGDRARPPRRRPHPAALPRLPLLRPPRRRPAQLPLEGRGGPLARQGPDRAAGEGAGRGGHPLPRARPAGARRGAAGGGAGAGVRPAEPRSVPGHADGGHLRMTVAEARPRAEGAPVREITYVQALNEALREEMERDPSVFVIGEDVAIWGGGGVFGVTKGLVD